MIEKIIYSNSVRNCLNYIFKEDSTFIASNMGSPDPAGLAQEFRLVNSLRPGLKHQVIHLAISLASGESLSQKQKVETVQRSLAALGYENCAFYAREHHDSEKEHYHVAVSPVNYDGVRIDRGGDRFKAKKICRDLEKAFGLRQVSNQKAKTPDLPAVAAPEIQIGNLKDALYAAILPAIQRSTTLAELAQDLLRHGIQMEASFSKTGKGVSGLGFRLMGAPGGGSGGYLKASEVHDSFSIAKLQKKHGLSYEPVRDDPHLAAMGRKPLQPVQAILGAMLEEPAPSPRVKLSAEQITRRILNSYKTRRPNANRSDTPSTGSTRRTPLHAESKTHRPDTPAVVAALLSTRRAEGADPSDRASGRPLRGGVVPDDPTPSAPSVPDHAPALGDGLPHPTPGLAHPEPQPVPASAGERLASRNDSGANLDLPGVDSGGGSAPPQPGRGADHDQSRTPEARPGVLTTWDHPERGRSRGRQRPEGPGPARERQPNASGGAHGASGTSATPGSRTGRPGVGGERGSGSPGGRTPTGSFGVGRFSPTVEGYLATMRDILAALPRRACPAPCPRVPSPREAANRLHQPPILPPPEPAEAPWIDPFLVHGHNWEGDPPIPGLDMPYPDPMPEGYFGGGTPADPSTDDVPLKKPRKPGR